MPQANSQALCELICCLQLRLTPDHLLYVSGSATALFARRIAVAAHDVRAGQFMWSAIGDAGMAERIAKVEIVPGVGIVAPFTMLGAALRASSSEMLRLSSALEYLVEGIE